MVGYVSSAVANALKNWDALRDANVFPVVATDGQTAVVNTPIPAVAIQILGDEGEGNTFFGGGIRQYFELTLHCVLPITNYTFSPDKGAQAEVLDISDEVIRCIELTKLLDDVKVQHDLNLQFDRMETEATYATKGANTLVVDVHKVIYKGSVNFDLKNKVVTDTTLEKVNIETENV